MVSEVSTLETSTWQQRFIVHLYSGANTNLFDRMQSDMLPWNAAGHVILSVLSN